MKLQTVLDGYDLSEPAAFRRLCVETSPLPRSCQPIRHQPPSGGCVLKQRRKRERGCWNFQPPSGGCVLKQRCRHAGCVKHCQPPSGGCVLKLILAPKCLLIWLPAAFRRLCVETCLSADGSPCRFPAAFRRLCVETPSATALADGHHPAAFRRLCVETMSEAALKSRCVPAAFRRLCVETQ